MSTDTIEARRGINLIPMLNRCEKNTPVFNFSHLPPLKYKHINAISRIRRQIRAVIIKPTILPLPKHTRKQKDFLLHIFARATGFRDGYRVEPQTVLETGDNTSQFETNLCFSPLHE